MSDNNPTQRGKIVPFKQRGVATMSNNSENDTDEDMDHDHNRFHEVEKSVQDTRELMLKGFGDVNAAIERTNTNIERTRSDMIERITGSERRMTETVTAVEKDMANKINTAEKDLSTKIHNSQTELGEKNSNRSWLIMGILLTALLGGMAIATSIIISVMPS